MDVPSNEWNWWTLAEKYKEIRFFKWKIFAETTYILFADTYISKQNWYSEVLKKQAGKTSTLESRINEQVVY